MIVGPSDIEVDVERPDRVDRADQIRTKAEAWRAFVTQASGRVLLSFAVVLVAARVLVGNFGAADLVVLGLTALLVGPFEWAVHRFLLHAPTDSRRMQTLGTGAGHVEHHKDPAKIRWLMLCWRDAVIFTFGLSAVAGALAIPVAAVMGADSIPTFMSAWALASLGLLHYEWTHLLIHTRYRCRTRYYRNLERHHRLHHYRNEFYWLGVTARSGDRLLRTMPDRSQVELSATARTLGHG